MKEVLSIVQGGALAFAGCAGAGWLALVLLRARLQRVERFGLAVALGSSVYTLLLLPLFYTGGVRRSVMTAAGAALVLAALALRRRLAAEPVERGPWWWVGLTLAGGLLFTVVWTMNALAPDLTKPGMSPALEQASVLWARHPLQSGEAVSGASPLWTAAFSAGRHSACSLLHTLLLAALAMLAYGAGRRWLGAAGGAIAALLIISNPGLGAVAADAGSEVLLLLTAGGAICFALLAWKTAQPALYAAAVLNAGHAALLWRDPQAEWFRGFLFGFVPGPWVVVPALAFFCAWLFRGNTASALLIVVFACLTSWPRITRMLAPSQKQIAMSANPKLALQRAGAEEYLAKNLPGYVEARFLDEQTPEGSRILVEPKMARAWTRRAVVLEPYWRSLAQTAYEDEYMPDREERIKLPAEPRREWKLDNREWVAEVRFLLRGALVTRRPEWRVACPEAFDNNVATACRGALRVDFGAGATFDEVRLSGKRGHPVRPPRGLRESIRMEWKRQKVTHLLAAPGSDWQDELMRHVPYWRVTDLGERNGSRLFRVE